MSTRQTAAQGRYRIEIKPNDEGSFNVISDGTSYRIHRKLPEAKANAIAVEIKTMLGKQGIRAVISKATECLA